MVAVPDATAARRQPGIPRGLVVPVAAVLVLEIAAWLFLSPENYTFAAPHDVALALVRMLADGTMLLATWQTLACALAGLAIGGSLGVAAGILLGLSPVADRLAMVTVETLRPVPPAALIPLVLLVAGFGFAMGTTVVAFTVLWPVLVLSRAAIRAVEPGLIEVARVLELGTFATIRTIVLPSALPRLFTALRLATGIALTVAVVVEIVANPRGLGYGMILSAQTLHPDDSLAYLVWIAVVGWALNAGLTRVDSAFLGRFR
ncbi:MAG: ABC transporter permease [Rhodobacteraceae bacterium]|jgi:NitT/TauT family transport system permease protein|nr:ABC transporter permease [Paracoccaceae bacterium]